MARNSCIAIDLARHFHPFCLVVTKREKAKDFAFVFKSLKDGMKLHFANFDYRPDTLLADSAPAVTKGFTLGFGYRPRWRIICWAHALRKFNNKYSSVIPEPANKVKARADLLFLQTSESIDVFQIARKLLLEKWKKIQINDIKNQGSDVLNAQRKNRVTNSFVT